MANIPSHCPLCGGQVEKTTTIFSVDLKKGVVVVRDVPAFACIQCGEEWLDDETATELEHITHKARRENFQLEMLSMA